MQIDTTDAATALRKALEKSGISPALSAIRQAGGLPLLVGGAVRDALLGRPGLKDMDVEVHRLPVYLMVNALAGVGDVDLVGASFGVLKLAGINADFSAPRTDSKVGPGHKGIEAVVNPDLGIHEAARRRDLTVNSIAFDPATGEFHDPFGGLRDLERRVLTPTDEATFLEDPLRALRAAQFISRLDGFHPSQALHELCGKADLSELAGERIFEEFRKLLSGARPAEGLDFMELTDMVRFFPELRDLIGCEQDPEWHPEGDVWVHTLMAVQAARELCGAEADLTVMWAVLCHDLGKPSTTRREGGRVRSRGHEVAGIEPSKALLGRMKAPNALVDAVCAIAQHHLAPAMFCGKKNPAGAGAFRRLALKLADAGTSMEVLERVARADHFGRTTADALARRFDEGDAFLAKSANLGVLSRPEDDLVQGRHLVEMGLEPSPEFGRILKACRDVQFETGLKDRAEILRKAGVRGAAK